MPVPAATLWAALAADDAVVSWGLGATACRWTGGKPYGVGTVREETATGSRLTWTVAMEVAHLAAPTAIVLKPVLGLAVGSMVSGLRKKLATR